MKHQFKHYGTTLMEVMVASAIFGFSVLGIFGMVNFMFKSAVDNVAEGVSLHTAEGIMEQLRVQPYEVTLLPAARAAAGTYSVPLLRYTAAKASGSAAGLASQSIPVNATDFTPLTNVDLGVSVNSAFTITNEVPLDIGVRVLVREYSATNFARGVTVELIYRYRAGPGRDYHLRTLRTFIAQSVS